MTSIAVSAFGKGDFDAFQR
jgi:hypothetical protein